MSLFCYHVGKPELILIYVGIMSFLNFLTCFLTALDSFLSQCYGQLSGKVGLRSYFSCFNWLCDLRLEMY